MSGDKPAKDGGKIVRFPQSRVPPGNSAHPVRQLGLSDLAKQLGAPGRQGTGHWCNHCQGIWYGYLLEVTCPNCGRRAR